MGLPNSTASSLTEQRFCTGKIEGTSSWDGYLSYVDAGFSKFFALKYFTCFFREKKNNWMHPSSEPLE
jgi:hypothetical protein